jgi:hypothetical protein
MSQSINLVTPTGGGYNGDVFDKAHRLEVIFSVRTAQVATASDTTQVRGGVYYTEGTAWVEFERENATGMTLVIAMEIIEYTETSGVFIHHGSANITAAAVNLTVPSYPRNRCYVRITAAATNDVTLQRLLITAIKDSDTNVLVRCGSSAPDSNVYIQVVYIPDQLVWNQTLNSANASQVIPLNESVPDFERTFILNECRDTSSNSRFTYVKAVRLLDNNQVQLSSDQARSSMYSDIQLVYRPTNTVRGLAVTWQSATTIYYYGLLEGPEQATFVNVAVPYQRLWPGQGSNNKEFGSFMARAFNQNPGGFDAAIITERYFSNWTGLAEVSGVEVGELQPPDAAPRRRIVYC